jgi:CBS domain-containing protein
MNGLSWCRVADLGTAGSLAGLPGAPPAAARIADIMTPYPITADAGASIAEAIRLMLECHVGGLPVVHRRLLVGIITRADVLDHLLPATRRRWWTVLTDHERLARECQRARGTTVGEVMTRPAISLAPDETLAVAAQLLRDHRIGRLPVVDHGRLVGIVSDADLLQSLAGAQPAPGRSHRARRPATDPGAERERDWAPGPRQETEDVMGDVVYVGLVLGFFALSWAFIALCDRL